MTWIVSRRLMYAGVVTSSLLGLTMTAGGCGLLDATDPTAIEADELDNADGAQLLRGDAIRRWQYALGIGALASGMFTDEYIADGTFDEWRELLDRRSSLELEERADGSIGELYGSWLQVRHAAVFAIAKLRTYAPPGAKEAHIGEMFALRGFATLQLAEDFCPGFPLHEIVDYGPVISPPLSTEEVLDRAAEDFDSAVAYAADSARVSRFAAVGLGRVRLAQGDFLGAAAAVAQVSTEYVGNAAYVATGLVANPFADVYSESSRSVGDSEGTNGMAFVSAGDGRVQTQWIADAPNGTPLYRAAKYETDDRPIVAASGIEARLIEAEAALDAGSGSWLTILNALRTTCVDAGTCPDPAPAGTGAVEGLPPLADPGSPDARVDLLFRERAFWLFATDRRLGDLRRLVRLYGRAVESVFPTGAYWTSGNYSTGTSIPFPADVETAQNPAVTGCTSR